MSTPSRFINPYAFVPLPRAQPDAPGPLVRRELPTFHDGRDPKLYSGTISVTWTLASPFLIPKSGRDEEWLRDGVLQIPGSSIAGAVRSLHETLFNGCFRVVDTDFVPAYREAVTTDPELRLGVVAQATNGVPTEIQLCDKDSTAWIDSQDLLACWRKPGPLPTAGDLFRVANDDPEEIPGLDRSELRNFGAVTVVRQGTSRKAPLPQHAGSRVLLVTSTSARKGRREDGTMGRALWASGVLTHETITLNPKDELDRATLDRFNAACAGSDDRRRLDQRDSTSEPNDRWRRQTLFDSVRWPKRGAPVGQRQLATGFLFPGDVVWVRVEDGRITEIKLSAVWRDAATHSVSERLPRELHPCAPGEPPKLCLSCATFGAADTTDATKNRQSSYAGHVRFSAARSMTPIEVQTIRLAPLGIPHPGVGMFYLSMPKPTEGRTRDDIASHWDSDADQPTSLIAGRKFYWHSDPERQRIALEGSLGRPLKGRYEPTPQQSTSNMQRKAEIVLAESHGSATQLRSRVTFDQLDAVAIHCLLAALDPGRVLRRVPGKQGAAFATHLGGGKPFGFGSVTATIDGADIRRVGERYGVAPDVRRDFLAEAFPFKDAKDRLGYYTGSFASLASMLDLDGLGANSALVCYPPGDSWDGYQHPTRGDAFGQSYNYFKKANGQQLAGSVRPWHALPSPIGDPTLPVDPEASR